MNEVQVLVLPELKEEMINCCDSELHKVGFWAWTFSTPGKCTDVIHSAEWDNCHEICISSLFWLCIFCSSSWCIHSEHTIQLLDGLKWSKEQLQWAVCPCVWYELHTVHPGECHSSGCQISQKSTLLGTNSVPREESEERVTKFVSGDAREERT